MDIKTLREKHNLTQSEFAERLGVTSRSVQNWEMGGVIPAARQKMIEQLFGDQPITATADNHSTSVAAAPNATVNIGGAQQQVLDKIHGEIAELRRLMQNDCTAKNAVIKELLALLKKQ